ncbi:hypothetical protein ACFLZA_01265 [Candidatus Neomarinimicrobiota bacterium]
MKKTILSVIVAVGLIKIINAQGITNTLGGNTSNDKFIVENSDSESGLVVTGEGNVGVGTTNPLSKLSVGGDGLSTATISSETAASDGIGVRGYATNSGAVTTYGGYFVTGGLQGTGVLGVAWNSEMGTNFGGKFEANGGTGVGVRGYATNSNGVNYGVFGKTESPLGWAGYFEGRGYFRDNVGVGTNQPLVKLQIRGSYGQGSPAYTAGTLLAVQQNDEYNWAHMAIIAGTRGVAGISFGDFEDDDSGYIRYSNESASMSIATGGSDRVRITHNGRVGIGTIVPQGSLDVNGPIYQRGGALHADYVFDDDYILESINEHSEYMWSNKHLPAIPKAQVDDDGNEIVEVGSHRKGIVEELEKAHIYIAQLEERLQEVEKLLIVRD